MAWQSFDELWWYVPFPWERLPILTWARCTGILSQGLRIAPPEAPVTGYMFGKGVYFADVSLVRS